MFTWLSVNINDLAMLSLRLLIAAILGGLVGFERERSHQPAGFRTHMLVCIGSALVMVTAEYLRLKYQSEIAIDPTRLGAQVISGIGFLGAGTIIRHGSTVRGLTTAAGLWAVSCIGLAVGSGFYEGAIIATLFTTMTLWLTKPLKRWHSRKQDEVVLMIQMRRLDHDLQPLLDQIGKTAVDIRQIQIAPAPDGGYLLRLCLRSCNPQNKLALVQEISRLADVESIQDEE